MWMVEALALENETPSTVPHAEYACERRSRAGPCSSGEMVLTGAPVSTSQLISFIGKPPRYVSKRPSGEKMSHRVWPRGELRMVNRSRVVASRISIVPDVSQATAMNLLHGDHATAQTLA